MKKIYIILFSFGVTFTSLKGQDQHEVDSLLHLLQTVQTDTAKVAVLTDMALLYSGNDPAKGLDYATQALQLSEKIGYQKGLGFAYEAFGSIESDKGEYFKALDSYRKSLAARELVGDQRYIANAYNNIGTVYQMAYNLPEAIKFYYKALKIHEALNNKRRMAGTYNNLGLIYYNQGNFDEAIKHFKLAYKYFEETGNKKGIGAYYQNIGMVYDELNNYSEATSNYDKALKIKTELNDKRGIAMTLGNIGYTQTRQSQYETALKNTLKGLEIAKEIGEDEVACNLNINVADIYNFQKNTRQAIRYINEGLILANKMKSAHWLYKSYETLVTTDSLNGDYKKALADMRLYVTFKDSTNQIDKADKLEQEQLKYDFDKKEAALKYEKELTAEQLKQQKTLTTALIIGLIALLLAAALWYQRQKQKELQKRAAIQVEFTQQLLENIEEERGRIAIDLHDSISHELLSLKRGIKQETTEGVHEKIDGIIDDIRQISRNLHPVLLDKIGLKLSIETLCEQYGEHETLFVSHDIDYEKPLPKPSELQIFRIIQEALTNTVKYAQANASNITMSQNTEGTFLEIKDNGKGFDVQKALDSGKSFGLHSVLQRSKAIGGKAKIQSSEQGTTIKITIPSFNPKEESFKPITNN